MVLRDLAHRFLSVFAIVLCFSQFASSDDQWRIGFSKVDVTPTEPLRLSGYAVRDAPHEGVADPLAARAMVISPSRAEHDAKSIVLVSIDSVAVSSAMTVEVAEWLEEKFSIARSQLVLCSTHSHTTPQIDGVLPNIFRVPSTPDQVTATAKYTQLVLAAIKTAIQQSMNKRVVASVSIANAEAGFAINRRVLNQDGVWTGFGEQVDAPVDRRVRLLIAHSQSGSLLGGAFMYACHCTTLGSDFNQVSGDWAGLSASRLELLHASAVFLPIIGCGADANPKPRGSHQFAQRHAAEIVSAVEAKLQQKQDWTSLAVVDFPEAHFGYAGLASDHPSAEELAKAKNSEQPNEQRWAEFLIQTKQEMGRLPETVPMPIHTWRFGDDLTWVFLGGEVVIDYQLQLEKELPSNQVWVAAYSDDVFAYVASERMRGEGGYEVDASMTYYLQPGRWQSGTQSLIIRRVKEIFEEQHSEEQPLSAVEALNAIRVPPNYHVELVAAEPMVQDPINLAFGFDGKIWIVEMSDYPLGVQGGGRVKWLRDNDADGKLDEAHVFLDGLSYPTSAMPWKNGVLVIAAPNVIFAEDLDGDGKADRSEVMLSGISEANPQHRASGFQIGLDGWLHFAAGSGTRELKSHLNGISYRVEGRDVAWNVDTGEIKTCSGETQFVRCRDDFGNWFGNSNSRPMYQYVIEDRYLKQGSVAGGPRQDLLTPAVAPPVYPRSRTLDRFNDLYALNRFTSACSSIIVRVPGASEFDVGPTALICEPVHNLVARIELNQLGSHWLAKHQPDSEGFDFFTSTDPWSRPVRAVNAPDGSVWIVDMVRRVIEHPEWIPTAWQQRLNLRSGSQLGRIYRVALRESPRLPLKKWSSQPQDVLPMLASENGAIRDLALQAILHGAFESIENDVRRLAKEHASPEVRASAWGCLAAKFWRQQSDLIIALQDRDARIVRLALELSEQSADLSRETAETIRRVVGRKIGQPVDLQWILTVSQLGLADSGRELATLAGRWPQDPWILRAFSLIDDEQQAMELVKGLLAYWREGDAPSPLVFSDVEQCLARLWNHCPSDQRNMLALDILSSLQISPPSNLTAGELLLLATLAKNDSTKLTGELRARLEQISKAMVQLIGQGKLSESEQRALVHLLGSGLASPEEDLQIANRFLSSDTPPETRRMAIEALRRLRDPGVATILIANWDDLDSGLRAAAGATLLSRREWASSFVTALESGKVDRNQLDLSTLQQLSTYSDRALRYRCIELFGTPTQRTVVVADYLARIPAPTQTPQGEKLFADNCAACHKATEGKPQLGPPLENLKHWTLDQWVTAILDPNQSVDPKYRQSILVTQDGQALSGMIVERSAQDLLLGISDGSFKSLPVSTVAEEKDAGISLMPVGFEQKITPVQLSELLGYLRSR